MKKIVEQTGITVIIPVHELNDITKPLFANAITSIKTQLVRPDALLIVIPKNKELNDFMTSFDFRDLKEIVSVVINEGETDFASQINFGVANVKTEWFSVLEYDDEFANIWIKNAVEYKSKHTNIELFLPIVIDVDSSGNFIGLTNEAVWANSFSDELGVLDNTALLTYQNFNIDGMVIKKSVYDEVGGFKPSIKLTFIYEFLLRMTFKDVKVMVIPKFGYKHINQRSGSLFASYKETLDPIEARWWLSTAKKEYFFKNDRKITYDTQQV